MSYLNTLCVNQLCKVYMCAYVCLPCSLSKMCQFLWCKRTEDVSFTDSSRQTGRAFILFTGSLVRKFDEEQFASLDDYEEVGFVLCHRKSQVHTLLAPKTCPPHHQVAPTLCSFFSALLAPLYFHSLVLCCEAKSTC
ncbi:hypothetical protein CHARACLAT_013247 [Characodon lateralis]|uniref:Uncharacterized protein n=1 Tax=Characodon lateralis TaxID=208331 RepID=A0ABU7EJZ4_9TELE|nr:hypothetical protein [Characodon lateralis]